MGQQQLLLIVLGVIIVGIAVAVGITMFGEQSAQANLDAVVTDLQTMSARAHQYYLKPTRLGGGGKSFVGLTADAAGRQKLMATASNDNGTYEIMTAGTDALVVLRGIGVEDGDGADSGGTASNNVEVEMYVYADASTDSVAIKDR